MGFTGDAPLNCLNDNMFKQLRSHIDSEFYCETVSRPVSHPRADWSSQPPRSDRSGGNCTGTKSEILANQLLVDQIDIGLC